MEMQKNIQDFGGTMRLGAYECQIVPHTLAAKAYQQSSILERHRHRYEFNNNYLSAFEKQGMQVAGINPQTQLAEIIALEEKKHPFYLGVQYHPEYKSTVENPHPLFAYFIEKVKENK